MYFQIPIQIIYPSRQTGMIYRREQRFSFTEAIYADSTSERRGERRRHRGSELQRNRPAWANVAHSQSSR